MKVVFKDPFHGETVEVDATPEAMTPVMARGWVQVKTEEPAIPVNQDKVEKE